MGFRPGDKSLVRLAQRARCLAETYDDFNTGGGRGEGGGGRICPIMLLDFSCI
jgi:hypothetical protein